MWDDRVLPPVFAVIALRIDGVRVLDVSMFPCGVFFLLCTDIPFFRHFPIQQHFFFKPEIVVEKGFPEKEISCLI